MKRILQIGSVVIALMFVSCSKVILPDASLDPIFGHWQLYATSGGFTGGGIQNLDVSKISITITKQGKYLKYNDGVTEQNENYEITTGAEIGDESDHYYLHFKRLNADQFSDYLIISHLSSDTLYLSQLGSDTYSYHYVRD